MASMMCGGAYFAGRAWELLYEQVESIFENQTYIDELKDLYGTPRQTRFEALQSVMGSDWLFWLVPTTPLITVDYSERLWTKQ